MRLRSAGLPLLFILGILSVPVAAEAQRIARVPLIGAMKDTRIAPIGRCSDDHAQKPSSRSGCELAIDGASGIRPTRGKESQDWSAVARW